MIPIFFRVFFFFGGHLPQMSGFRSAKQILVVSFATQARAFILSDCNIFYTRGGGGGEQRWGLMPLGLFLFIVIVKVHVDQLFIFSYPPLLFFVNKCQALNECRACKGNFTFYYMYVVRSISLRKYIFSTDVFNLLHSK